MSTDFAQKSRLRFAFGVLLMAGGLYAGSPWGWLGLIPVAMSLGEWFWWHRLPGAERSLHELDGPAK